MLLGLAAVAVVGLGFLIAWLASRNSGQSPSKAQTIIVTTTARSPSVPSTTAATTTASTTTTKTTTSQTTAARTTTASAPRLPATATVPSLSGTEENAADALSRAGLLTSLVFVPSSDTLGTFEAQAKPAGTTLPYQTHVQVNIATGPGQKVSETVPNVVGEKLPQAVAALNAAGLRLIYVKYPVANNSAAGTIVQQSPLSGEHAPHNAQVLVYMAAVEK